MAAHARLSPSDASRWMQCPGAINLCDKLKPNNDSNEFAAEGTFGHDVREMCLEFGLDANQFVGYSGEVDGFKFECDDGMADFLQPGIDQIRTYLGPMFVEKRIDLSRWMPGQFGTLDLGIAGDDLIVISDLKYGIGVIVDAVENKQQQIYALGFWDQIARHLTKAKRFLIIIDQPRVSGRGGEWFVTLEELLAFGEEVEKAAKATRDPNAKRCASSSACMWCPASKVNGACPEYEAFVLDIIGQSFDSLDDAMEFDVEPTMPNPLSITPERRTFIINNRHVFTRWLEGLHDQAVEDALRGAPVPGLKIVEGRSMPRKYKDKEEAEKLVLSKIGTDGFKQVLKTPSQIEKQFGKEVLEKLSPVVIRGEPKPQLVDLRDARPALEPVADKFDDLTDDDILG